MDKRLKVILIPLGIFSLVCLVISLVKSFDGSDTNIKCETELETTIGNVQVETKQPETTECEEHKEEVESTECEGHTEETTKEVAYVNGEKVPQEIYEYLKEQLKENGLEYWTHIALAQMYQESRFNIYAKAQHNQGYDCGLLQFYDKYWNYYCDKYDEKRTDIYDWKAQIRVYCKKVKNFKGECSCYMCCISSHYTGGEYYDYIYVRDVLQWIEKIKFTLE